MDFSQLNDDTLVWEDHLLNNEILVDRLNRVCRDKSLTPSQVEKALGLSPNTINTRWKKFTANPGLKNLLAISRFLGGISLDYLVGNKDSPEIESSAASQKPLSSHHESPHILVAEQEFTFEDAIINATISGVDWHPLTLEQNILDWAVFNELFNQKLFPHRRAYYLKEGPGIIILIVQWNEKQSDTYEAFSLELFTITGDNNSINSATKDKHKLMRLLELVDKNIYQNLSHQTKHAEVRQYFIKKYS